MSKIMEKVNTKFFKQIIEESTEIFYFINGLDYTLRTTILDGAILVCCPNRATLDCVLEEVCVKYGRLINWTTLTQTKMVIWHVELG